MLLLNQFQQYIYISDRCMYRGGCNRPRIVRFRFVRRIDGYPPGFVHKQVVADDDAAKGLGRRRTPFRRCRAFLGTFCGFFGTSGGIICGFGVSTR